MEIMELFLPFLNMVLSSCNHLVVDLEVSNSGNGKWHLHYKKQWCVRECLLIVLRQSLSVLTRLYKRAFIICFKI